MSVSIVLLGLIQPILSIISRVLFSMWIYKDSKKKNLQSACWWIIGVVFLSWVPLVIYLIYSKDKPEGVFCPICNAYNFHDGGFCVNCGNPVSRLPKSDRGLLYGGVIAFVISLFMSVLILILCVIINLNHTSTNLYEYDYYEDKYIEPFANSYYGGISTYKLSKQNCCKISIK